MDGRTAPVPGTGEKICNAVGNSGGSFGSHLHFEERRGSTVITPYFDGVTQGARNLGDVFDNLKVRFADMVSDMASRLFCS